MRKENVVAIEKREDGRAGVAQSEVAGGADAAVLAAGMLEEPDLAGVAGAVGANERGAAVGGAIVDDDQFPGFRDGLGEDAVDGLLQEGFAIPDCHENGDGGFKRRVIRDGNIHDRFIVAKGEGWTAWSECRLCY